jgi:filamentous hemagglutinin
MAARVHRVVRRANGADVRFVQMSDWADVQGQLGEPQMWNINKAFLDQQMAAGKSFLFTADPAAASVASYTYREYQYLQNSGYTIGVGAGGYYHAIKK